MINGKRLRNAMRSAIFGAASSAQNLTVEAGGFIGIGMFF